jgi:hypothetical protein
MKWIFKRKATVSPFWWEVFEHRQLVYKRRLGDWLNHKAEAMSARRLRCWMILFIGGLATINIGCAAYTLWLSQRERAVKMVFEAPVLIRPRSLSGQAKANRTLHAYLDSLRRDSVGSLLLDSLLRMRPGLVDSIREAEVLER